MQTYTKITNLTRGQGEKFYASPCRFCKSGNLLSNFCGNDGTDAQKIRSMRPARSGFCLKLLPISDKILTGDSFGVSLPLELRACRN
ncbi:MAG: hypothetical protein LBK18_04895 [Prevotellaceae bacterium]|nr:hypothetical protein [Prevotellaceae bacterium]